MNTKMPRDVRPGDRLHSNDGPLTVALVEQQRRRVVYTFTDGTTVAADPRVPVKMW